MLEFNLDHYGKQEKVQVTVNLIGQLLYRKTSSRKYIAIAGLDFRRFFATTETGSVSFDLEWY